MEAMLLCIILSGWTDKSVLINLYNPLDEYGCHIDSNPCMLFMYPPLCDWGKCNKFNINFDLLNLKDRACTVCVCSPTCIQTLSSIC